MIRVHKNDRVKYLVPGAKIIRIIKQYNNGKQHESEMIVARGPYLKHCETFGKSCEYIDIESNFYADRTTDYFVSDLFNGEIYVVNPPKSVLPDELFEIEI